MKFTYYAGLLGKGLNSVTCEERISALDLTRHTQPPPETEEKKAAVTYQISVVKTFETLRKLLGIKDQEFIGGSFRSGLAELGSAEFFKKTGFEEFSVYIAIQATALTGTYALGGPSPEGYALTSEAMDALTSQAGSQAFYAYYGDAFLSRIEAGTRLTLLIKEETFTKEDQDYVFEAAEKYVGTWEYKDSFRDLTAFLNKLRQLIQKFQFNYFLIDDGNVLGAGKKGFNDISADKETLVRHFALFHEYGRLDEMAVPLSFDFTYYSEVLPEAFLQVPSPLGDRRSAIENLISLYQQARLLKNHAAYILECPAIEFNLYQGRSSRLLVVKEIFHKSRELQKKLENEALILGDPASDFKTDKLAKYEVLLQSLQENLEEGAVRGHILPASAKDLRDLFGVDHDGDFYIFINGEPQKKVLLHCADMGWGQTPKEYITLSRPEDNMVHIKSGGEFGGTSLIQYFSKIRLNINTMEVDIFDARFTQTEGGPIILYEGNEELEPFHVEHLPYGFCMSGSMDSDFSGYASMDLSGTGLKFSRHNKFSILGDNSISNSYVDRVSRHVIKLYCLGNGSIIVPNSEKGHALYVDTEN